MTTPTISNLTGTGYKQISTPRLSPQQQKLFSMLFKGSRPGIQAGVDQLSQMAQGGSPEYWQQLEAPALRQFGALQGNIASRFSQEGGRRSSGFQNTLRGEGTDLAERLQSQRLQLQQDAITQLLGIGSDLLGTDLYDTQFAPKKKSFWQELLGSSSGGIGSGLGAFGISKLMGL